MKQVAGTLKLELAQFRELEAFSQFASDLDADTRAQLERGARMIELLKQGAYSPVIVSKQICAIYAGIQGYLDTIPLTQVSSFEMILYEALDSEQSILKHIIQMGEMDKKTEKSLKQILKMVVAQFKTK